MIHPLLAMALVLVTLGIFVTMLKVAERPLHLSGEVSRKIMHTGIGLATLGFPWLFDRVWPVILLAAVAAVTLLVIKWSAALRTGIGSVLMRVERPTLGEVYFPIAVGVLFVLSFGDWKLFVIPMLILSLADALAALIGIRYGTVRYQTFDGRKSAEGSVAFFVVAFLSVHVPLILWTQVDRANALLIAMILGLLVMLLEAMAWHGLDNLFIPLGAFAFLKLYVSKTPDDLLLRLGATILLVIFAFSWRRRTTLDDSALIGSALFGYAAWMLGGWPWLIAPLTLFLVFGLLWPRGHDARFHTIFAVLSVASAGLLWLMIYVMKPDTTWLIFPYSAGFAAHLAIIRVSQRVHAPAEMPRLTVAGNLHPSGLGIGLDACDAAAGRTTRSVEWRKLLDPGCRSGFWLGRGSPARSDL